MFRISWGEHYKHIKTQWISIWTAFWKLTKPHLYSKLLGIWTFQTPHCTLASILFHTFTWFYANCRWSLFSIYLVLQIIKFLCSSRQLVNFLKQVIIGLQLIRGKVKITYPIWVNFRFPTYSWGVGNSVLLFVVLPGIVFNRNTTGL